MIRETAGESALDLAAKRLERAVAALEQKLGGASPLGPGQGGGLFDHDDDATRLRAELDRSRARERELEEAGAEASAALGRAIVEIKAALNGAAEHA